MNKQVKKTAVPSRDERMEKIGVPKLPKIGGIVPANIILPRVDDLLDKMKQVTAPVGRALYVPMPSSNIMFGWNARVITESSSCSINCKCPPCQQGDCRHCLVDEQARARLSPTPATRYYE